MEATTTHGANGAAPSAPPPRGNKYPSEKVTPATASIHDSLRKTSADVIELVWALESRNHELKCRLEEATERIEDLLSGGQNPHETEFASGPAAFKELSDKRLLGVAAKAAEAISTWWDERIDNTDEEALVLHSDLVRDVTRKSDCRIASPQMAHGLRFRRATPVMARKDGTSHGVRAWKGVKIKDTDGTLPDGYSVIKVRK